MSIFNCPMCTEFCAPSFQLLMSHIRLVHATKPGFRITCSVSGCQRTFTNMKTYGNHMGFHITKGGENVFQPASADHSITSSDNESSDDDNPNSDSEGSDVEGELGDDATVQNGVDRPPFRLQLEQSAQELQLHAASWILKTKESYKLTQSAMDNIIEDVTALTQVLLGKVHSAVSEALNDANISESQAPLLSEVFSSHSPFLRPFQGLETAFLQAQYCKANLGLIEPRCIVLGTEMKWRGVGENRSYREVKDQMIYIPMLETLRQMLEDSTIMTEIVRGHASSSKDDMEDFCDGEVFKTHQLFKEHPSSLALTLYYDDVEVCNPLGSKRKIHKLGIFYFMMMNLPPRMRSRIHSIQLVALVKKSHIDKYSMQTILKPFINDLKKLEVGYQMNICKVPQTIYGTLIAIAADNPASSAVGEFKESGSAYRYCRQCLTISEDISSVSHEDQCSLRTPADHQRRCEELALEPSASREHGINCHSVLNDLKFFHVCNGGLLPDIMHDVLEGVLPYETKLMLKRAIQEERYLKFGDLQHMIENFELGYAEVSNRPSPIALSTLTSNDNSLKQNASQMWLLGRYLPLMIGSNIPEDDEHWMCFILLLHIMRYLFSPKLSDDDLAVLQVMIQDHHQRFVSLYPANSVTPKLHYLIHMPRLIHNFGPLVCHWTMRYEAKHKYFKQLASIICNFINLPYTLAMRHQFLHCYLRLENPHNPAVPEVGKGVDMTLSDLPYLLRLRPSQIYRTKWVKVNGVQYMRPCIMTVKPCTSFEDPTFARVEEVYVVDSLNVYLHVQLLETTEYCDHFAAYICKPTQTYNLIALNQFVSYLPLHAHKIPVFPTSLCIVPKFILK